MDENYCEAFENIYIPLQHPSKFWVGRAVVIYTQACLLFSAPPSNSDMMLDPLFYILNFGKLNLNCIKT